LGGKGDKGREEHGSMERAKRSMEGAKRTRPHEIGFSLLPHVLGPGYK
jgi:hypothetical protein